MNFRVSASGKKEREWGREREIKEWRKEGKSGEIRLGGDKIKRALCH